MERTPFAASAQAHGKAILVGEHAVVYGYPALAVGLPMGIEIQAEPLEQSAAPNRLEVSDWGIDLELSEDSENPVVRAANAVLLYCGAPSRGYRLMGKSSLPSRAGLGSSAAMTVALAKLALGPKAKVSEIVNASMEGEKVFHGQPSGLDSEVSARGGLVRFSRETGVEAIHAGNTLPLVVISSGKARNTAKQIDVFRSHLEAKPTEMQPLLEKIGALGSIGLQAIKKSDFEGLGKLFEEAHEMLRVFGVSCVELDEICSRAKVHGAFGAKLTGAGGGGCVLALPRPGEAVNLAQRLASEGLQAFPLEIDCA